MRRPNLFCVGAMKSGTTYFSQLLGSHPEIFICAPREPCFFVDPNQLLRVWPYMWRCGFWRSEDSYLKLFAAAGEAQYVGDASTPYSASPDVAARIHRFAPESRILYVMRDPLERTIRHYWHAVNHFGETRKPLAAIRADPYYMAVSHYARQLAPYLDYFGAQRVYTLTFEELVARPVETMQSVYAWLGVDAALVPPEIDIPLNVTPDTVTQARGWVLALSRTALWRGIRPYRPEALRKLMASFAVRRICPADVSVTSVIEFLRPIQREQTRELSRLLNRGFPEWTALAESDDGLRRPLAFGRWRARKPVRETERDVGAVSPNGRAYTK